MVGRQLLVLLTLLHALAITVS